MRVQDAGQVTCTFADPLSNILWLGHSDGRVSAFSMGDAPGTAVNGQLLHCWQVGTSSQGSLDLDHPEILQCAMPAGPLISFSAWIIWDMNRLD